MSRRIAELLEGNPAARAVLLAKHGLVTWGETGEESYRATIEFVTRAAQRDRPRRERRLRPRRPAGRRGRGRRDAERCCSPALPALRGALLEDADGVDPRGRPQPGGGRVRLGGAHARGEPGRRAVPRPPDQHEAQAARRRLRPGARRRDRARRGAPRSGVAEYAAWYRDYYERNLDDESRPFPIDPPARASSLVPGVGIVTSGSDAGQGARRARPLPPRDRGRGRGRRDRRLPVAERGRGVRDRVLAARALQARAGAAARRARRPRRGDHRRRERDRPADRAPDRRPRRATSSSPT